MNRSAREGKAVQRTGYCAYLYLFYNVLFLCKKEIFVECLNKLLIATSRVPVEGKSSVVSDLYEIYKSSHPSMEKESTFCYCCNIYCVKLSPTL